MTENGKMNKVIGERIKAARKVKGLSQDDLGNLLGVSFQAVSSWGTGKFIPDSDHLAALAKALDLSLDALFVDEEKDWETFQKNGILDYIYELKKSGVVRHIGLSSHTPSVIQRILDDADVDMLMFSVNPAYDYGHGEYANGSVDERSAVYRRCEKEGIGISVMKPFSGGQLLDAKQSPFGKALTQYQCIRYCLDKPGILTVLPGAQSVQEVKTLLAYYDQPEDATDYSVISSFTPPKALGKCVYCNHCKPCPVGIDIGLVNKYYDLALAGDAMAVEHYRTLEKNADDCIGCGHCDNRCPFSVKQSERMQEIRSYMGLRTR